MRNRAMRNFAIFGGMLALASAGMLGAVPVTAQEANASGGIVARVYACRAISDATERLACFDREVAALETAQTNNDVRIVDREQVRQARRGLFGLSLPSLGSIFGGDGDEDEDGQAQPEEEGITFIESRIASIGGSAAGRRLLVLENGQQWEQIEPQRGRAPIAGAAITIRRAILGSYVATVEGRGTLRVMRIR